MTRDASHRRGAFSLVELLVCIGIILVLIAILVPVLRRAREAAGRARCSSNLRQILQATVAYAADNEGSLPQPNDFLIEMSPPRAGWLYKPPIVNPADESQVETGSLWQYLRSRDVYRCSMAPTDFTSGPTQHLTSYMMNMAVIGFGTRAWSFPMRIMKPSSVLFWEAGEDEAPNVTPISWNDGSAYPWDGLTVRHGNGGQIGLLDGSVEWMSASQYQAELTQSPSRFWCNPQRADGH